MHEGLSGADVNFTQHIIQQLSLLGLPCLSISHVCLLNNLNFICIFIDTPTNLLETTLFFIYLQLWHKEDANKCKEIENRNDEDKTSEAILLSFLYKILSLFWSV